MIDPEDLAAFLAAVADVKPLPPVDRVHLTKTDRRRIVRPLPHQDKPAEPAGRPVGRRSMGQIYSSSAPMTSDPELAAFHAAMVDVRPLPSGNRAQLGHVVPPPYPRQFLADEQAALHASLHGALTLQDRLEGGDETHYLRRGLASNVLRDLRRGRWVIQDEVDLHGLNRDAARHLLAGFLAACLHRGKRCVRVIHGKGLGSPQKLSILRQLVRGWLAQRIEVLAYCQAKPQDGGEGALIVLLRAAKTPRAA